MDLNRTLGKEIEASTLVKKMKEEKEDEEEGKTSEFLKCSKISKHILS